MRARLAALIALASLAGMLLAPPAASAQPAPDFGAAPSGSVPILFNDHHVYARPDKLKEGRVLAALVRGGTVLIPLRSMFEQMGATVSYDAGTQTVDVTKAGADVKVTVGKAEVVINGEQRPLDVPPEIYQGTVVVPVRVISEGMGAYVQWVPDKRVVVVRYLPATPPPVPPPPPAASEAPATEAPAPPPPATPSPAPTATPRAYDRFVAADYVISPKVYNELASGNSGNDSFDVEAALELPVGAETVMVGGTFRQFQYPHDSLDADTTCTNPGSPGCRTVVGNGSFRLGTCPNASDPGCVTVPGYQHYVNQLLLGQAYVPAFTAQERDADGRIGLRVADPRVYLALSYYGRSYNYLGYPSLSGLGFGIEKLPDLERAVSLYGNVFLYPGAKGNYTGPVSPLLGPLSGASFTMQYTILRYEIGAAYAIGRSPFFVETKFLGDRADAHADAPASFSHTGGSVGIGLHF